MQTGCFSVFDGDIFKLFYFQSINLTGAKHIETVLIENMFTDAVSAYEEYGAEYYKLVQWSLTVLIDVTLIFGSDDYLYLNRY